LFLIAKIRNQWAHISNNSYNYNDNFTEMKHLRFLTAFLESEKSGGVVLMVCGVASLVASNSLWCEGYQNFWRVPVLSKPLAFWINDGLMTIFFLQVGLEIEREIYIGELKDFRKSLLPVIAAMGGMVVSSGQSSAIFF